MLTLLLFKGAHNSTLEGSQKDNCYLGFKSLLSNRSTYLLYKGLKILSVKEKFHGLLRFISLLMKKKVSCIVQFQKAF